MPERIVVSFRGIVPANESRGHNYLERAMAFKKRAETFGATLCAWSASTFSFDFSLDDLEEAVSLAILAADENVPIEERFCVGLAQGLMSGVGEGGSLAVLSWGRPLVVAVSLARIARPGDVLVDPEMPALTQGELLVTRSRIAMDWGGTRVRGVALDVTEPWRRIAAKNVSRLEEPDLVGHAALLSELEVPMGGLGVIRADPGAGGTRVLSEFMSRLGAARSLLLAPVGATREPLGALRRALSRSAALHGAPALPERLAGALGRVLAGEGADLWSVAELVDTWLAPEQGRFGVLGIDDACEVDETSLEAIASALAVRGAFRAVARIDALSPIPSSLAATPAGSSISLGHFARQETEHLVCSFMGGEISTEAMQRWARRSGGLPLGVREALAEGLTSGELSWRGARATPRRRAAGRGSGKSPRQWIELRIRYLSAGERAALTALALFGGDASDIMVDALAVGMEGLAARSALADGALVASGWVSRPEQGWLRLTSRTACEALCAVLEPDARRLWHLAAAETIAQHGGVLARADAAWHASQGGERRLAAELAIDAARAAAAASLEVPTAALLAFAHAHDVELADKARRDIVRTSKGSFPPPPSIRHAPLDGLEDGTPLPMSAGDEPRGKLDTLLDDSVFARFDPVREGARRSGAPPIDSSRPVGHADPGRPAVAGSLFASVPARAASVTGAKRVPSEPADPHIRFGEDEPADSLLLTAESPVVNPGELATRLAEQAKDALVQGDLVTLEHLVGQLRVTGEHAELVDRMSGFISLARGAKSDGLRKLRAAIEAGAEPAQQARARLAYGIALAAAGRPESAMLEALDALARAREAGDSQGEHACTRFLARVSSAAGHAEAAAVWTKAAELASRS